MPYSILQRSIYFPLLVLLAFCIGVFIFCCFYTYSDYNHLVNWYMGLNGCIYHRETWSSSFFTPGIKSEGNIYCIIGMLLSAAGIWTVVKKLREKITTNLHYNITVHDVSMIGICMAAIVINSLMGSAQVYASNDEVFSAFFCAGIHPFQTASYYMKPNNHILFNLLTNLFTHFSNDNVAAGRFVSLGCCCSLVVLFYYWQKKLLLNKWVIIFTTIALGFQFPIWGFSFQARGYELMALGGWVAFLSFFKYTFEGKSQWLPVCAVACIAAYFCIPTFLYFHLCLILFSFSYQLLHKKRDFRFWKYQLIVFAGAFLVYLPCLCFSGIKALTANEYVTGSNDISHLVESSVPWVKYYLRYCFLWFIADNNSVDLLLFLTPLLLLLYRKNRMAIFLGYFFIAMWVSCFLLIGVMKVFPPARIFIIQLSITLSLTMYTVYLLLSSLAEKIKLAVLPLAGIALLAIAFCINDVTKGPGYAPHGLCNFPVNKWHDAVDFGVSHIPRSGSVAFSDECVYWYYLAKKNGYAANMCWQGNERYYVKSVNDSFPPGAASHYFPLQKLDDFTIYMKKLD